MKKYLILLLLFGTQFGVFSQTVEWLSWEEAMLKLETEPRKIFVDIYTDWCTYCKKMDRETFSNPYVAKYLNENFYPVKLNAQQRNDIVHNNKIYRFINRGGRNSYHELAAKIMNGRLSYPTIVFLDENVNVIQSIPGYREAFEFELFITYFGDDHHKNTPWSSYKKRQPKGLTTPQINVKGN